MLRTELPQIVTDTLPGPKALAMIERRKAATPSAIRCVYPLVIQRGEGAMVEDVDGNKFLDWVGGVGVLNIGYSHPVELELWSDVKVECASPTEIVVSGIDKQKVGEFAANIRAARKPEPYKGKGIRYKGEYVRRKEGKTAGQK